MEKEKRTNVWTQVAVPLIVSIMLPLSTLIYQVQSAKAANEVKMLQIAIDILKTDPELQTKQLRTWAVGIVMKNSGEPFQDMALQEYLESNALQIKPVKNEASGVGVENSMGSE